MKQKEKSAKHEGKGSHKSGLLNQQQTQNLVSVQFVLSAGPWETC
jgi:hypothetical protein